MKKISFRYLLLALVILLGAVWYKEGRMLSLFAKETIGFYAHQVNFSKSQASLGGDACNHATSEYYFWYDVCVESFWAGIWEGPEGSGVSYACPMASNWRDQMNSWCNAE